MTENIDFKLLEKRIYGLAPKGSNLSKSYPLH